MDPTNQTGNMEVDETQLILFYDTALRLTKEAGKIIKEHFQMTKTVSMKSGPLDLVTETDQQVENFLVSSLLESFPAHKFIGEESVADGKPCILTKYPTWIIDPIDGTMNFIHGNPNICTSVALWINKKPYIGIIYNPILEMMFTAQRGKGAYLNRNRISASSVKELGKGLIITEYGNSLAKQKMTVVMENLETLIPLVQGVRTSGSTALNMAMVAMGAAECYFDYGPYIWDIAAGLLLVEEAGGYSLDPAGGRLDPLSRRVLTAGKEEFARKIMPILKQHYYP